MNQTSEISKFIKQKAAEAGFDDCGIAKAERLSDEENYLKTWIDNDYSASMAYMQRNFEMRLSPALLVDGAKTVVSLITSYNGNYSQNPAAPKIARYAWSEDYHTIIHNKLDFLLDAIKEKYPQAQGRGFVDSAPMLERAWAVRAGLGFIGKSSAFISPVFGSFVFLSELILNIDVEYDKPFISRPCGSCNRCMANCPNKAIEMPYVINAEKCISYQTIENKGNISAPTHGWLFGCDRCLQVCPYNKHAKICNHIEFEPYSEILNMTANDWENISELDFKKIFKNSPIMRTKYVGIKRNLDKIKMQNICTDLAAQQK